ncbi:hypothetical protein [Marinomonas algicola]|jgi:cytochrome c-type biogenesis protein CcmH/NrfF|nr:hypothetical protein [Marinomonas algicola]
MNPTSIALWSLGVLFVLKLIGYLVYKHLSKKKRRNDKQEMSKENSDNNK